MKCPDCRSKGITRLKRRRRDKVLGYVVPVRPYRCQHCDAHLWGLIRWRQQRAAYISALTVWGGLALAVTAVVTLDDMAAKQGSPVATAKAAAAPAEVKPSATAAPAAKSTQPDLVGSDSGREASPPSAAGKARLEHAAEQTPSNSKRPAYYATTDRAHLRAGAGRDFPSITILARDRILPVVEPASGEWIQLRHYGTTGYVHRSLLKPAPAPDDRQRQG